MRLRMLGLTVALGVLGSLVSAQASFADQPNGNATPGGLNCNVGDGRIAGNGSTLAANLENKVFALGFETYVCGPVAADTATPAAPTGAGNTSFVTPAGTYALPQGTSMVAYNDAQATSDNNRGSGAGLVSADCHNGNFWGTDIPYNTGELTTMLNAAPGSAGTDGVNCANAPGGANPGVAGYQTPYNYELVSTASYPQAGSNTAPIVTVPLGASAVTLGLDLTGGAGGTCPTLSNPLPAGDVPNFTVAQVSLIMSGDILAWNDSRLQTSSANTFLTNCPGAVTRVVRFDDSGSTNALKQQLVFYDNSFAGNLHCTGLGLDPSQTWSALLASPNTTWPGQNAGDGTCSTLTNAGSAGGGALVTKLQNTPGGVGYADIADINGKGLILPQEPNQATGAFVSAKSGTRSNCNLSGVTLPGSSFAGNVGLDTTDDWATDNATANPGFPNHSLQAITSSSTGWPGCTLTYALVFSGSNGSGTVNGVAQAPPVAYGTTGGTSVETPDQARTMYAYFSYTLTPAAQALLGLNLYQGLPAGDLTSLLTGFQQNF
jgi:hypothetical protein